MCTTIIVDYPQGSVMARTLDFEVPLEYNMIYIPRGFHYADDLYHKPMRSKYKMMGMCFRNLYPIKDGVNEHGLCGCTNMFIANNLFSNHPVEGKINTNSLDFMNFALGNYKTVEELLYDLDNIHLANKDVDGNSVICPDFHFMFVDRTGDSTVLEYKNHKLVPCGDNPKVMTNSPKYSSHVKRYEKSVSDLSKFNQIKDLTGAYDPVSRFIRAKYILSTHKKSNNVNEAYSSAFSILEPLKITEGFFKNDSHDYYTFTRYISAFDTQTASMAVRTHSNTQTYLINFDDIPDENEIYSYYFENKLEFKRIIKW